ncbi:MAG: hypothetical protein OXI52_00010 [Caldilineaceae bacterium]|nr:hypothetical protein [Caldilineaceae bacterium]
MADGIFVRWDKGGAVYREGINSGMRGPLPASGLSDRFLPIEVLQEGTGGLLGSGVDRLARGRSRHFSDSRETAVGARQDSAESGGSG